MDKYRGRTLSRVSPRAFPQSQECWAPSEENISPGLGTPPREVGLGNCNEHCWGRGAGLSSAPCQLRGAGGLTHLLLVLPLGVESRLDALPGLLERLSLRDFGGVVGADAHDVGAGENEDIGDKLQRDK